MSVNGDDGALADITNKVNGIKVNEEALKRVRDAQWAEPEKYDYETYNAPPKDQRSAAPAESGEADDVPVWAGNATRYEWKDEYGEVGPEHPALEKMLFKSEWQMEKGNEFSR